MSVKMRKSSYLNALRRTHRDHNGDCVCLDALFEYVSELLEAREACRHNVSIETSDGETRCNVCQQAVVDK